MKMEQKTYQKLVEAHAPRSPILRDCLRAFWTGGAICLFAQGIRDLLSKGLGVDGETAGTVTSVALIVIAAILSGIGVFDKIAKYAGAGTLVPITGFANSVVSPAIDSHAEGLILGVGAKIFTVAGPVLLYGTLAGALYGTVYYLIGLFL